MNTQQPQIIATLGPSSSSHDIVSQMADRHMGVVRLNFSWGTLDDHKEQIDLIRRIEKEKGISIPIILDLPGPRIQEVNGHTYNHETVSVLTEQDISFIKFGIEHSVDYIAVSFVAGPADVLHCKQIIEQNGGKQKVIAKIERQVAVDTIDEIINVTDAIMIARGDLGNEIAIEKIPFVQADIIARSKKANKTVIVATQMLLTMTDNPIPTRAEVTDVANATLQGADAVMLSEESARGKYPVEAVSVMERIVIEAEKHIAGKIILNPLIRIQ